MPELQSIESIRRWRTTAAGLLGAAVLAFGFSGLKYEDLSLDKARNVEAQRHGDAYFKGVMQTKVENDEHDTQMDALIGGVLAIGALATYIIGGRRNEEAQV